MLDTSEHGKRSLRLRRLFRSTEMQANHDKTTQSSLTISAPIIHSSSNVYCLASPTETPNDDWQRYPQAMLSSTQPQAQPRVYPAQRQVPLNSVPPKPRTTGAKATEHKTQDRNNSRGSGARMVTKSASLSKPSQSMDDQHDMLPSIPEGMIHENGNQESRFLRSARDRRTVAAGKMSYKEKSEKSTGDHGGKPRRHSSADAPATHSDRPASQSRTIGSPAAHAIANIPIHSVPLALSPSKSTPLRIKTYNVRNQHESPQRQRELEQERRRKQLELEQLISGDRRGSTVKLTLTPRKVLS